MAHPAQKNHLVIVYHADCIDGAASAWIIAKARHAKKKDNVTYIPYAHDDMAAAEDKIRTALKPHAHIYFADVMPEKHFLNELLRKKNRIHILDHHQTALDRLANYGGSRNLRFHVNTRAPSAAKMIWQDFFPKKMPPAVIDLIDLMDGSAAGLKTPEDFAAAALVDSKDIRTTAQAFDTLRGLAKLSFNDMAQKGGPLVADQEAKISKLLENAPTVSMQILPGTKPIDVPIVNGDIRLLGRQISGRLIALGKQNGANVAFIWSLQKTGAVSMSIRSDGNPDASRIAAHLCKTMGVTGGGHRDAAAVHFSSISEFTRRMLVQTAKPAAIKPKPPSPF